MKPLPLVGEQPICPHCKNRHHIDGQSDCQNIAAIRTLARRMASDLDRAIIGTPRLNIPDVGKG